MSDDKDIANVLDKKDKENHSEDDQNNSQMEADEEAQVISNGDQKEEGKGEQSQTQTVDRDQTPTSSNELQKKKTNMKAKAKKKGSKAIVILDSPYGTEEEKIDTNSGDESKEESKQNSIKPPQAFNKKPALAEKTRKRQTSESEVSSEEQSDDSSDEPSDQSVEPEEDTISYIDDDYLLDENRSVLSSGYSSPKYSEVSSHNHLEKSQPMMRKGEAMMRGKEEPTDEIKINLYKAYGTNIASNANGSLKNPEDREILKGINVEESDEEEVYPLSIKYNPIKARKNMIIRYILLLVIIILLIPTDLYTDDQLRKLSFRIGYMADRVEEKAISFDDTTEFKFKIDHCLTYILENKETSDEVKIFVSADRDTDFKIDRDGSVATVEIKSNDKAPLCYAEIKVPGGVQINKMYFSFEEGSNSDMIIYDYKDKDDESWEAPMKISTLQFIISDSYPAIKLKNEHEIEDLIVSGSYCDCSFERVKIKKMNYDVTIGSLNILQNKMYSVNKLTISTPHGTH